MHEKRHRFNLIRSLSCFYHGKFEHSRELSGYDKQMHNDDVKDDKQTHCFPRFHNSYSKKNSKINSQEFL